MPLVPKENLVNLSLHLHGQRIFNSITPEPGILIDNSLRQCQPAFLKLAREKRIRDGLDHDAPIKDKDLLLDIARQYAPRGFEPRVANINPVGEGERLEGLQYEIYFKRKTSLPDPRWPKHEFRRFGRFPKGL
jgi:hypothetical protein